jgi:acyl-[acyl-carrier-protein] desaturase
MEVIQMLQGFVSETVQTTLLDPDDCWQPTDFLPDMTQKKHYQATKLILICW